MTLEDIRNYIVPNNFGVCRNTALPNALYGTDHVSNGILYAALKDKEFEQQVSDATKRFFQKDWGTWYAPGEKPYVGYDKGSYDTKYGEIWIWNTPSTFGSLTFFPFEE
jgi:hypothetical protein